jgi:hypothetical protein
MLPAQRPISSESKILCTQIEEILPRNSSWMRRFNFFEVCKDDFYVWMWNQDPLDQLDQLNLLFSWMISTRVGNWLIRIKGIWISILKCKENISSWNRPGFFVGTTAHESEAITKTNRSGLRQAKPGHSDNAGARRRPTPPPIQK